LEAPDLSSSGRHLAPLRPDGDDGYWVVWGAGLDHAVVTRRLADGMRTPYDTLSADFVDNFGPHVTNTVAISQDPWPKPAIAWMMYGRDGVERIYVSWPSDAGWTRGQFLPDSEKGGAQRLALDENEDVWIAWWKYFDGIFWTHSHATATTSPPVVTDQAGRPALHWTLSSSAEGTWWAVLRAVGDGDFQSVARLRAGAGSKMSWHDASAPLGAVLRYAIRRECRDARYRWTSEEARWDPRGPTLVLALKSANPALDRLDFEIVGADSGVLEVRLFDLQGREVARQSFEARGAGRDSGNMSLPSDARTGLYLMRVQSADGRRSPVVKITVVR
jgi:hypothetical protein